MFAKSYRVIGFTFVLSGCGAHSDESLQFRQALDELQAENTNHAQRCGEADSMDAMMAELERHANKLSSLFEEIDGGMNMMGHCYEGDSSVPRTMVSAMRDEDATHGQRMADADSVDDALLECLDHTETMDREIEEMRLGTRSGMRRCM